MRLGSSPCTCRAACPARWTRPGWRPPPPRCRFWWWTRALSAQGSASRYSPPGRPPDRAALSGEVAAAAARRSERLRSLFCLASLDHLRHGGRIGGSALLGTTLSVKPLMHIVDGQIIPFEKARTMARAVARLEQLAVEFAAGRAPVDVAVQHLANGERAAQLAQGLRARIPGLRTLYIAEVGAVIAVHTGPDMLGVAVAPA